ncbi:hypothetical protein C440_08472 [Haloferax mucosum ATCC BAA-1512]|uniref:DUF7979 domain-containing protein n=1 Tax=Haloferax mucosum ATCC BAA-1512 TaxID=662479 RepID=M0IGC2_9EURY|nr:hypothetical protein [Haloferax mucosum]ELZ95097.1 hypothetical protein C440_08472 [Haloferax mucosum ATCC BAA-1512]
MTTKKQRIALLVSLALLGGGMLGFGFGADRDYTYQYEGEVAETPETVPPLYSELSESSQDAVDRALDGEVLQFEDSKTLPGLVERDGTYHAFAFETNIDYADPTTIVPMVTLVLGLVGVIATVRWEVTSRYVTY